MGGRKAVRSIGAVVLLMGLLLGGTAPTTAAVPSVVFTFDGAPPRPKAFEGAPHWDVTVNIDGDDELFERLKPMDAVHGPHCEAPPATHRVSAYRQAVFKCNNHVMTAINASGYGAIYLTPDRMIDFTNGTAVLKFDMSTLRMSTRDWVDIWITPYQDASQIPLSLDGLSPSAYAGPPRNAVHITMEGSEGETRFDAEVTTNFQTQDYSVEESGYEGVLRPDAARRDTFELRISRNRIMFGLPKHRLWWVNNRIPALSWTRGVVQFGHHSYNPTKASNGRAATWHWDTVSIRPAKKFRIIDGNRDDVSAERPRIVFDRPAPRRACLRFVGIGRPIDVRFPGRGWQRATLQAHIPDELASENFASFVMPIPAGTQAVRFRGGDWYGRDWRVKDVSIFAGGGRC
jgi:hypothetical protein